MEQSKADRLVGALRDAGKRKKLTVAEARGYMAELTNKWELRGVDMLRREFSFRTFPDAMVFVNDVAAIAEDMGHHPDIVVNYRRVVIELTTHDVKGLSLDDFMVAKRIDLCC